MITTSPHTLVGRATLGLLSLALTASTARADTLELANGDVLKGSVTSLTKSHVVFDSETLGEVELPRTKVRAIHLGDAPVRRPAEVAPPRAAAPAAQPADGPLQQLLGRNLGQPGAGAGPSPEDLVRQMQQQGVDAGQLKQLQQQFPLLSTPQAGGYFNSMLGGLVSGEKDLQDLRRDAVRARDELRDLKQELGAPGNALNGYLSILDGFIAEAPAAEGDAAAADRQQPKQRYPDGREFPKLRRGE